MAKETSPKIGTIRFTQSEKEAIALGVDSDFFKIIERKFRPQRQTRIGLMLLNMAATPEDIAHYKGRSLELDFIVKELRRIATEFNKSDLDPDTAD